MAGISGNVDINSDKFEIVAITLPLLPKNRKTSSGLHFLNASLTKLADESVPTTLTPNCLGKIMIHKGFHFLLLSND